jgi:hypothetical protein
MVVADGHLRISSGLAQVYAEERCWNHRILYVLDRIPRRLQASARPLLTKRR